MNEMNIILTLLTSLVVILITMYGVKRSILSRLEDQFTQVKKINQAIEPEKGLESNLDRLLEIISDLVDASTYTFYVLDKKGQQYMLKSVRYKSEDFGSVRPSYSGLTSYKERTYMPPLSISISKRVYEVKKVVEGEIPIFYVPVGGMGLILIGPIEHIRSKQRQSLELLCEQMSYLLQGLIVSEENRSQAQVVVASGKALQKISNISMDWKMMMEMMIKLCIQSIDATGGFLIQREEGFNIAVQVGLDRATLRSLNDDIETLESLYSYVENEEFFFLKQTDAEYYRLPPYFSVAGMGTLSLIRLDVLKDSLFVLWFDEGRSIQEDEKKMSLRTIIDQVRVVIGYQAGLRHFSSAYLDILKLLARLVDNLNPYTIGYSEMMSRYCVSIARKLELNEEQVQDIALASYLCNIGIIGLSNSLFEKEGKFTDEEFELMKLHSEVGASIVNVATGNDRISSYIMHHHERMDGNGYPDGLKDQEIPIGSRIIAVVQTFLAKIHGRKYREPLAFDQALNLLESSAGAQLDEEIVQTFIKWYTDKRLNPMITGRPLGKCWELLCVPSGICQECPVYHQKDLPCWEVDNNKCLAHGKSCNTCVVKTEYMTRNELKIH